MLGTPSCVVSNGLQQGTAYCYGPVHGNVTSFWSFELL